VSGNFQYSAMQKHVARAVSKLDEAEALLRIEPLYDALEGRPAWGHFPSRPLKKVFGPWPTPSLVEQNTT
jgi:hypothetical protein